MTTLQCKIERAPDGGQLVHLSGLITEEADFQPLIALEGPGALRLELGGVEQINSCGVREWITFVRQLSRARREFELLRCSPAIVRQLNTISNFCGAGSVRSVMLPYYCIACRHEEHRLLELSDVRLLPTIEDSVVCAGCGGVAEFDDIPGSYLAFAA